MASQTVSRPAADGGPGPLRRVQSRLHRRPGLRVSALLALPMTWMLLIYLIPLALIFVTAFWTTDSFTGLLQRSFSLENFQDIFTDPNYYLMVVRTVGIAAAVTVLCVLIGLPMAFFMARVASPRWQPALVALVLTPLWASYLVKVYAWRTILAPEGPAESWLGASPGYGLPAVALTLTYLWLPYMILPIYAGLANMRGSFLDAASDLGARPWLTFRTIVLPMVWPSVVAGSIFTFSLSLGDYITVQLVGGSSLMIGNAIYQNFSVSLPFAAALATIPVIVMVGYLLAVRRTGALDNL
ncbi:ABC transporter permease [Longivirga aurantiaca]|uniref:ABC transporter permease n=1 Tax=Longivirga aurantiaca TaxID=1837743 RepID=A0ABW1SXL2_9ACTN